MVLDFGIRTCFGKDVRRELETCFGMLVLATYFGMSSLDTRRYFRIVVLGNLNYGGCWF